MSLALYQELYIYNQCGNTYHPTKFGASVKNRTIPELCPRTTIRFVTSIFWYNVIAVLCLFSSILSDAFVLLPGFT